MRLFTSTLVGALALLAWSVPNAHAHIQVDYPAQRCSDQKTFPCGGCDDRSDRVTVFEPGQTITVQWRETVSHPGHYRIAFDSDGSDDFEDPAGFDDIQNPPVLPVLLDGIFDPEGLGPRQATVTLPDIECENCTLQLIQVMTDKGPVYGDNDLYYQCADIALRADGAVPAPGPDAGPGANPVDPPGGDDSGGCSAGRNTGSSGSAALILGLALIWCRLSRRHRRQRCTP